MKAAWNIVLHSRSPWVAAAVGTGAALLLLLLARTMLGHQPLYDELLHVLSARGLLESGVPAIADGQYTRARLFTELVALCLDRVGDTLIAARLPSLAAAMLLVFALGFWITWRAGALAAVIAATTLCLMPGTVRLSVFVRFYTLHALVIVLLGILAFEAARPGVPRRRRIILAGVFLLLAPLGWHLQPSTAIAIAAIAAGVAAVLIMDNWSAVLTYLRRHPFSSAAALLLLTAGGLAVASWLGLFAMLREAPLWAAWAADKPQYYVQRLARDMPLLWPVFPVAAVLAFRVDRRLALYSAAVVLTGFVVHSIAAAKDMRYVYYLLPFMCVILGLAIKEIAGVTSSRRCIVVTGLTVLVLALSTEGQSAAKLLLGKAKIIEVLPYTIEPDWAPIEADLRTAAESADRVVTSNSMKALYYFGHYDYELNVSIVAETDTGQDYGLDWRTGRRAIGSAEAVSTVIAMPGETLFVLEEETMNSETGVPESAVAVIRSACVNVVTAPQVEVQLWRCGMPEVQSR